MNADQSIQLKSLGYNLAIDFVYNAGSGTTGAYGRDRSCSLNAYVVSATGASKIIIVNKGDGSQFGYSKVGTAGGITTYTANSLSYSPNTIIFDGTYFTETLANGAQMVYSAHTAADPPVSELIRVVTPQQAIATYNYGTGVENGVIKTIQTPDGRVVSLSYTKGNQVSQLYTVQDWGGRVWSMSYDSNFNLTQFMTPTGCATQYGISTFGINSLVSSVETPDGYITQYGYTGVQVATMVAGSAVWSWTYGGPFKYSGAAMVDPAGGTTTWILSQSGLIDHLA